MYNDIYNFIMSICAKIIYVFIGTTCEEVEVVVVLAELTEVTKVCKCEVE